MVAPSTGIELVDNQKDAENKKVNHEHFNPKQLKEVLMQKINEKENGEDHNGSFGYHSIAPNCASLFLNNLNNGILTTNKMLNRESQTSMNP